MRLATLQVIWQRCVVIQYELQRFFVNYVIFSVGISEIVFCLCVMQNGKTEFGATLCH